MSPLNFVGVPLEVDLNNAVTRGRRKSQIVDPAGDTVGIINQLFLNSINIILRTARTFSSRGFLIPV